MTNLDIAVEQARTKRIAPASSKESGQRSLQPTAPFFLRNIPQWTQPDWIGAQQWRAFVQSQTVAIICRESITNNTISLDWKISPRDSTRLDELKPLIDYYTAFLNDTGEYEFSDMLEWLLKDYLDLPFGGCAEVGREGDSPTGKVRWIKLLDGGTMFPTGNAQYPIGQALPSDIQKPVFFPAHAINRLFMSPRTEFMRSGWGMAPPEKIYMAIELISRGDKYYSNLLLDTPEAGLLDLINMSKESAENWIEAFRTYMQGIDPFKIPVLYEHDTPAKWIPFGRPPTELMFDGVMLKYSAIVCAGYGLTLSDIGFASSTSGGDTLAGSIRQERKSKRQGYAKAKIKLASWFNRLIDPTQQLIKFEWVDLDDEFAIAQGRARLANATAMQQMIDCGLLSPQEGRLQMIADRTFTISMPEKLPPDAQPKTDQMTKSPERPGMLGKPVSPSQGGHGEILPRSDFEKKLSQLSDVPDIKLKRLVNAAIPIGLAIRKASENLTQNEMLLWAEFQHNIIWGDILDDVPELLSTIIESSRKSISNVMVGDDWWKVFSNSDNLISEISSMIWEATAEREYVAGKISTVDGYKPSKTRDTELRKFLSDAIEKLNGSMKRRVENAVLSGLTQFSVKSGIMLDETLKIDDNLLREIRGQLTFAQTRILSEFAETLKEFMERK